MSTENIGILATPEDALIGSLERYLYGGRSIQTTTLVGILQLLKEQRAANAELASQVSALQISHDNIINSLGIKGDGPWSKLVIEYVLGLVAENARMREAIEFATAPDMWQEQHDGMLDYRYVDWYVDVLNAAVEPKGRNAAIAEIKAQGVDEFAELQDHMADQYRAASPGCYGEQLHSAAQASEIEFAANLRFGMRKVKEQPHD